MKQHWHTGIESLVIAAVGVAIVFHAARFTGAYLHGSKNPWVSKFGQVLGATFTFGGQQ